MSNRFLYLGYPEKWMKQIYILVFVFFIFNLSMGSLKLNLLWAQEDSDLSETKEQIDAQAVASQQEESEPTSSENNKPNLMDIDYRGVDIREVARAFSEVSGVNIIVSSEAQASVTLKMSGVDWRTALEVILDTYNLAYIEKENFLIITTLERRRMQEESGSLEVKILRLNFGDVSEIQGPLKSILTNRGTINIDVRTNSLILMDIRERLKKAEEIALQLDTRTPQVLIEIMIVDFKLTDAFKWGLVETLANAIRPEAEEEDKAHKWIYQTGSDTLGVSGTPTFKWAKTIFRSADLDIKLQSILTNTKSEILANPKVVTLDNLPADIDIVTQEPYTQLTQSTGGTGAISSTAFMDIGIKLTVTPHITKDRFISMEVETEHSVKTGTTADGIPIVDQRTASTNVLVKDGETIVMGGLRRRDFSDTVNKVPLLGDIPWLGNLFRSKDKSVTETELVMFITPHLIGDSALTTREMMQIEQMKQMRDLSAEVFSFKGKQLLPLRAPIRAK